MSEAYVAKTRLNMCRACSSFLVEKPPATRQRKPWVVTGVSAIARAGLLVGDKLEGTSGYEANLA